MKFPLALLITVVVLSGMWSSCDGGDDKRLSDKYTKKRVSDKIDWWRVKRAFRNIKSWAGNACMNVGRIFQYDWMRFRAALNNKEYVLGTPDAAYHFQKEHKAREDVIAFMREELAEKIRKRDKAKKEMWTLNLYNALRKAIQWFFLGRRVKKLEKQNIQTADDLRKQEYFCYHPEISPADFCRLALYNKELKSMFPVVPVITDREKPECKLMPIYLPQYDLSSERAFLRCPIRLATAPLPLERQGYMYISSVDNPPQNRMRFYLFVSPLLRMGFDDDFYERLSLPPPQAENTESNYQNHQTENMPVYYPPAYQTEFYQGVQNGPPASPYYQYNNNNLKGETVSPPRKNNWWGGGSKPPSPDRKLDSSQKGGSVSPQSDNTLKGVHYPPVYPNELYQGVQYSPPTSPDRQYNDNPKGEPVSPPRKNNWWGGGSKPPSPDRQVDSSQKGGSVSPPRQNGWFQGGKSRSPSPDPQMDGSQKGGSGSPPRQTNAYQGVRSGSTSPDRQSDKDKKNIFSIFSKKPAEAEAMVPLRILTLVLNKDTRDLKEKYFSD